MIVHSNMVTLQRIIKLVVLILMEMDGQMLTMILTLNLLNGLIRIVMVMGTTKMELIQMIVLMIQEILMKTERVVETLMVMDFPIQMVLGQLNRALTPLSMMIPSGQTLMAMVLEIIGATFLGRTVQKIGLGHLLTGLTH